MSESLEAELVHVTCPQCGQVSSFSLGALEKDNCPPCPYCGRKLHVPLGAAEQDASRKAHELDQSIDALGSIE